MLGKAEVRFQSTAHTGELLCLGAWIRMGVSTQNSLSPRKFFACRSFSFRARPEESCFGFRSGVASYIGDERIALSRKILHCEEPTCNGSHDSRSDSAMVHAAKCWIRDLFCLSGSLLSHRSFAYSALASLRAGTSGSAVFHKAKNFSYVIWA